jgi:mannose-6-phosphate isomerase
VQADGSPRELHVDKALDVIKRTPLQDHMIQPVTISQDRAYSRTILCACDYFAVEKLDIRALISQSPHEGSFCVLTAIDGAGVLRCDLCDPVEVETGETILIPASSPAYTLEPVGGTLTMLQSYVPDLERDIVEPLRTIGTPPDGIRQLGGDPGDSHLGRYL